MSRHLLISAAAIALAVVVAGDPALSVPAAVYAAVLCGIAWLSARR